MPKKDFRVKIDLNFAPADEGVARGLYNHVKGQLAKAKPINPPDGTPELTYIELQHCGHNIGEGCEEIEREEVPG